MKKSNRFLNITQGDSSYTFLPTGDVFTLKHNAFLANTFRGNAKDGSPNNIWLRIYQKDRINAYPLLGIRSGSKISAGENAIRYEGEAENIHYEVLFRPVGNIWFWDVTLEGSEKVFDLMYGQDIGVGAEESIYTNELYMSQYLGHRIFEGKTGYVVCSRQNIPNHSAFPYIQQGVLGAKAEHFSTDGLQFFGLSYKETGEPEALKGNLADENLQYEFAYTALPTEKINLNGSKTIAFYGYFLADHPNAVKEPEYQNEIITAYASLGPAETVPVTEVRIKEEYGFPFSSLSFTDAEIDALYPQRNLIEEKDGQLYSFFTPGHAHVVTKEKEIAAERPHGTIVITPPDDHNVNSSLISSTHYMYGIFNSHVSVGNTNLHKMISTPRGFLNLTKNSGQRLYVRLDGIYRLLNIPGLFEMGMNYSKWFYKTKDDTIVITSYTAASTPDLILHVASSNSKAYDYIITNQLSMGTQEYAHDILYEPIRDGLRFILDTQVYPGLHYDIVIPGRQFTISDDRIFFADNTAYDESFLTLSFTCETAFEIIIRGRLDAEEGRLTEKYSFHKEKEDCLNYYKRLINHFHLENKVEKVHFNPLILSPPKAEMGYKVEKVHFNPLILNPPKAEMGYEKEIERIDILNETVWWYAHNAMIHFAAPHGLEQPGGAAWGTRDICQGPMEFFLAAQHYDLARSVLLKIFAHQNRETREWPQWFMYDRYAIDAGECHGDVILWPLKCAADYLYATGDSSILHEYIPYADEANNKETLLSHIKNALSNIKETRMIKNTGLITYACGDWDDTLQPADPALEQRLVSAWTVALAYQTFHSLASTLKTEDKLLSDELAALSVLIKSAFNDLLIKDGVIAGFLEHGEDYKLMLHPDDRKTGIQYRLLPLTRSIIAELVTPGQADRNVEIIQKNLKHPDGVRLMNKPAAYNGGVSTLFKRAEQAANIGREISLQYTHAHIRYIEAMAKLGNAKEAWDSLFVINPILIQHTVPNAKCRQSNMYFSSSDGAYKDRYEYAEKFDLLKTGSIDVKGGWRLYSSGPGIYMSQLISNILGIRFCKEGVIIDPVLPAELDGTIFTYDCFGRTFYFQYHLSSENEFRIVSDEHDVPAEENTNPYRNGGLLVRKEVLDLCGETIDIYAKL